MNTQTTYLMNAVTGSVDTADNWKAEMADWGDNAQAQFDALIEAEQDCSGDWVEVGITPTTCRYYRIEMMHNGNWEPLDEGDFGSLAKATSVMLGLENEIGWRNLRIRECVETDSVTTPGEVMLVGKTA